MIPKISLDLSRLSVSNNIEPSKNHKMHLEKEVINGYNDLIEGVKQTVFKILNTERYQYYIYSKNYGIELNDLFGEPVSYVCPELERRISEALTQDNRIKNVDSFEFELKLKRKILVRFIVHTIFGDFKTEKEVGF